MVFRYQKVRRVRRGDRVAVLSPSGFSASRFPAVVEKGIEAIRESFGLVPVTFPGTFAPPEEYYRDPQLRARDLNEAYADDSISAIFATIGGDESIRVLPHLDAETIADHPKAFIGFSDNSTYHCFLSKIGIHSVHGSTLMTGFAQSSSFPREFLQYHEKVLFGDCSGLELNAFPWYSEGYPDWSEGDPARINEMKRSVPWRWLQGSYMSGRIFAGCIEVLDWVRGTPYWPGPEFWDGVLLFLETSEEVPSPLAVERFLRLYGIQGILGRIGGLAFGKFRGYSDAMREEVEGRILRVVTEEFGIDGLPVLSGVDFGHTDPRFPLPIGINAEIGDSKDSLRLLDSMTK